MSEESNKDLLELLERNIENFTVYSLLVRYKAVNQNEEQIAVHSACAKTVENIRKSWQRPLFKRVFSRLPDYDEVLQEAAQKYGLCEDAENLDAFALEMVIMSVVTREMMKNLSEDQCLDCTGAGLEAIGQIYGDEKLQQILENFAAMTQAGELSEESLANPVVVLTLLGEEEELSLCALYFMSRKMMEIMLWEEAAGAFVEGLSGRTGETVNRQNVMQLDEILGTIHAIARVRLAEYFEPRACAAEQADSGQA